MTGMKKIHYTREQLENMSEDELAEVNLLLRKAAHIEGTAVVRRADGSIKYDDPKTVGSYKETG